MIYFENSRIVSVEDLYKVVNEDGERIYSDNLLQKIQSGYFNCLNEINLEDRNNRYFMEPILFAVKNSEFGTYEVFKYYGEELQKHDLTIATEIVINEPEVMEDTVITDNPTLVLYFAKINPDITLYISEDLKSNGKFIEDLCETGNKEAISNVIEQCNISEIIQDNPDLASNPVFMMEAVKEDSNSLKYADESLKNSYEFIKESSLENREVIDYVVQHTNEFGNDALKGAKESLVRHIVTDIDVKIEEEKENILLKQGKEKEQAKQSLARTKNSVENTQKRFEQMMAYAYSEELTVEEREKVHEKIIRHSERLLNMVKGMTEDIRSMLEQYKNLSEAELSQMREKENKQNFGIDNLEITPEQIEEKTDNSRISEINVVTKEIREEYISQTKEEKKEVSDYDRGTDE